MSMLTLPTCVWTPSPNFSSRGGQKIRLVVVHDCEGSYSGSIAWFADPKSQVSAHYVLNKEGTQATQMVLSGNKAWHCCDFNSISIGVEMEGFEAAGFPSSEWSAMTNVVAYLLHTYGLPAQWAEQGQGEGFCRHFDLGVAGGSHKDPTTDDSVWQAFCGQVRQAAAQQPPQSWPITSTVPAPKIPPDYVTTHSGLNDLPEGSIEWVQMNLNTLAVTSPPLLIDGLDTQKTRDAISAFQAMNSISRSGLIDTVTISALKEAARIVMKQ